MTKPRQKHVKSKNNMHISAVMAFDLGVTFKYFKNKYFILLLLKGFITKDDMHAYKIKIDRNHVFLIYCIIFEKISAPINLENPPHFQK